MGRTDYISFNQYYISVLLSIISMHRKKKNITEINYNKTDSNLYWRKESYVKTAAASLF